MSEKRHEKLKLAERVRRGAILLCLLVFVFSVSMLLLDVYRSEKEKRANQELQRQVRHIEASLPKEPSQEAPGEQPQNQPEEDDTGMLPQYEPLWQQNNDLAGWLFIDDLEIDYPVMYTPDNPEYYLRRAFDHSDAVSGCLFIDGSCALDSNHLIIYGHQMNNGTMFGSLSRYAEEAYTKEHPTFSFDTLYEQGEYQVLAAFYGCVYTEQDQDVFRYYQYTDLSDYSVFMDYVRQVEAAALYDTGVEAQYGDSLLTLSTCSSHVKNGRFVVVARKIS